MELTGDMINRRLHDNGTLLRYAGEYKRGQYVLLKCDKCGSVMRYSSSAVFKRVQCKECKMIRQIERLEADRQAKSEVAEERKRIREQKREAKFRDCVCPVCGETFRTNKSRQITCSAECSKKRLNALHSRQHDKRIQKDKRIDRIDLHDLFKRDGGVCHICGKQCNWNDYTVSGTAFIAGNWYPSVDHIVPVSLGGADSYDNVKLAHRICNSVRGNKV